MTKRNILNIVFGSLTLLWSIGTCIAIVLILPHLPDFWGLALMIGMIAVDTSFVWILIVLNFDFRFNIEGEN